MNTADTSCTRTSANAAEPSQALAAVPLEKPATDSAANVGSCSRPYTPRPTLTRLPTATATSSTAIRVGGVAPTSSSCGGTSRCRGPAAVRGCAGPGGGRLRGVRRPGRAVAR